MTNFDHVHILMQQGVNDGVFPGAVLLVSKKGDIQFFQSYGVRNIFNPNKVTTQTVFDLASLTKPLATTLAVAVLISRKLLKLDQQLGELLFDFKDSDKACISIRQLLNHSSGLPDYQPYYIDVKKRPVTERNEAIRLAVRQTPLMYPVGQEEVYSDIGFMILGWIIESVSGKRLDQFVVNDVFRPLGINLDDFSKLCFVDIDKPIHFSNVAATEICPWRQRLIEGTVHDDNAHVMGGIAGHAGLFGNAQAVLDVILALEKAHHNHSHSALFSSNILKTFFERGVGGSRPLGFDAPSPDESSSGRFFSSTSVGHLGFTGTSFWFDTSRSIVVILLSNRVHPHRDNERIKFFRPQVHDAVMTSLLSDCTL
jgi:CubicO group peptidase (beta-lactamase class C family)